MIATSDNPPEVGGAKTRLTAYGESVHEREPLTAADLASVLSLLGEIGGLTLSPYARRIGLMQRLAALIQADVWICTQARHAPDDLHPAGFSFADGGWKDDSERTRVIHASLDPEFNAWFFKPLSLDRHITLTPETVHAGWRNGPIHQKFVASAGFEDLLISLKPLADGAISCVGLHRRLGREPYNAREVAIAHLVLGHSEWLHHVGLDVPANNGMMLDVPPRQREILIHLLSGDSRKQIARKLAISPHTVDGHIKELHRRFDVASRGELIAKFLAADLK